MAIWHRVGTWLTTAVVMTGGALLAGAGTSSAADQFTYKVFDDGKSFGVAVYNNGHYAGLASWNADPIGDIPGDALQAVDSYADGWGIQAEMWTPWESDLNYRVTTTKGHSAPYSTPWKSGNLKEGVDVHIQVCIFQGNDYSNCGGSTAGKA
ncbi:hypothetical protein [Streptomyces sp. N50]|uniref:hypothetical protein n=1 Tax=Streptomyces sp. N50 TaxID=3081765 RepID=UPI0029624E4A|nr:hypothetical protein [Streptomyces sp. N50]WOX08312.1 hypothetical protein R2B38_05210 [Streptomyces sp. N50]